MIIQLSLKFPGKGAHPCSPKQVTYGERCSVTRANGLVIHLCLSVPKKEPYHEIGKT